MIVFVICQFISYLYFEVYKREGTNSPSYDGKELDGAHPGVRLGRGQFFIYLFINLAFTIAFIWFIWDGGDRDDF